MFGAPPVCQATGAASRGQVEISCRAVPEPAGRTLWRCWAVLEEEAKAAESGSAEHSLCGTPGAQGSRMQPVPSSSVVSYPYASGREAEEAGNGYY